jgi:hypothetical protein
VFVSTATPLRKAESELAKVAGGFVITLGKPLILRPNTTEAEMPLIKHEQAGKDP